MNDIFLFPQLFKKGSRLISMPLLNDLMLIHNIYYSNMLLQVECKLLPR